MTEKLKPCPFCGSEAKPVFRGRTNYVVCSNEEECWCGMTCPVRTPEEAARIWNRRTNAKELVARINISDEQVRRDGWADSAKVRDMISGIADGLHGKAKENCIMMPKEMLYFADKLKEVVNR